MPRQEPLGLPSLANPFGACAEPRRATKLKIYLVNLFYLDTHLYIEVRVPNLKELSECIWVRQRFPDSKSFEITEILAGIAATGHEHMPICFELHVLRYECAYSLPSSASNP